MQDNINKLYNVLKNDGYEDLGTEEKFRNFVNDSANVKKLYGVLKNDGYEDLGTEDQFISFVMPKQQASKPQGMIATAIQAPEPPASIAKPENGLPLQKFNVAEQNQENAEKLRMQQENTPFMRQQRATEQQTTAMNQPAFPDIEAPQLSRSIGDDRQKYKGMVSQAIKDAVGAKSETALADAMKATRQELARQGYDMDALQDSGLLSEGIDNVIIPTAEAAVTKGTKIIDKVFDDALTRAKAARSRHIEPLRYAGAQSDLQMLSNELAGERAYNAEIDPDKLQAQLINAIDKDGLQETFKEVYRQASKYGINPKEYFNTYVAPHLKENAARALDKFMTDQYMPKDDAEYILSGFSNSITGMLSDWLTKSAKQNAYKQMALSKYDASTGTQIAREAVGLLSSAPEFMISGGVASAVTKKVCGKAIQNIMAKGFTRMQAQRILTSELASKFGQRVAERIVQSSVSGSANFATLESMSEAARQLRDDDFNAGKIALKGVEGAGKGAIFGAVSGGYAGATSELTGATKIISNFLGIPANGLSLTLSSNAINEISKMMGGEDELMEVDAEGNSKRKSFMQQWADNTLLDLMMRGTSPHNLNVITREGRTDISNRIRSFFSPLSESQQIIGKSFGSGISEEGQDRLMQITGTDNLRDALMSGVPKASDMPSLPFQAGRIDGKTRSRSVDDLLREEQRSVMQQNWDKIMHDRELTAADKAKLCMIMGAKYHANPSVTMTTVTGTDGEKYVEYRDAAGMLNERVPLYDADLGLEAQNKLRMRNIYGKTSALGKQGEYAVAAGATRYSMKPDAEGNAPTEAQQKARMKEYFSRFRKGELTDMEITELEADLNKATLGYDGADKIKVLKHGDGTASVQYTKNGVPVRTDHFGTEEEANERASRDLYQQQLNSMNEWREDVGMELDNGTKLNIQQVYELTNDIPEGTLQQAIDGYPNMSIEEVRDRLFNSGLTSVDLVTGPDGIIRTAEQDKLIQDYYDWAKKTVDGMDAKKAQPDTEGLYQMGEGGAPDSITPAFKAPETPIAENGPGTEEERTYNGPTTEAQVQQPEVQPQQQPEVQPEVQPEAVPAAPQNAINENTSHGKAYSSGYNAVSANDLATVRAIKDNQELAARRVNDVVKNTNPVIENILSLTKQGKHAEAHALIDNTPMPEEQADALRQYIDADAGVNGMQDAVEQIKDARIREYQAKIEAQAQENGEDVTIVVLDNSGKKAKLVKGDLDNMGGTVMIHDLDANDNPVGEPHQVHVKQIKRVFPTQKVKDMIFAERKRIQQEIDAYFDNAVSPTNFDIGKKVVLKDGENIIEATVVSVNPDGSINFQSDTGEVHTIDRAEAERMAADGQEAGYGIRLQAEAEARATARKQAEAQQKAQAEAETRRQAEGAARKAEEERRKNPLNRLKRREDNTIDYTNSNPDDVAELLQNLGAKGKAAAYQELAKVQDAIQAAEKEASAENTPDGIDALLAQEDRQDQRNARIDELKRQEAFWMDQISRIEAREEAIRKEEEHRAAERLKREQQRQRSIAAFNKPINDARKRMADDPDAMQILEENNREPRTLKEAVADLIPKNGLVLKNWTDSYGRKHLGLEGELGLKAEDLKKLSYFMGKLENGATDITTLAERIYENLPESLQEQAPDGSRDIRDLIIELLSEAQNADHIIHYIDNARIREAEAVYDANKAAEAEYERAMAEHNQEVENETAPTYSAAEDPFSGSAAEAPFSFRGIKTEADRQRHNKRVRKVGGLILDTESLPLEEKTKNLLDAIGRQLGKIFQVDPRVIEVGADGISQGDVIFLSPETVKNGDRFTRKISGHELTHAIKASSRDVREVWDKFLTFVQESMGKEKFNRLVDEKLSLYTDHIAEIISRRDSILKQANPSAEDLEYAQHYANLKMPTREGMMEEVASDFVGEHILTDEKFITDLVKRVEMSKADSASIIQRMRAFIDKMLAYLESLARPTSAERRARVALERARDIWADMYELVAAKQREGTILSNQQKFSFSERPEKINLKGEEYDVKELENDLLDELKDRLKDHDDMEIVGVRLVGSYMRGEERPDSDLDLLMEFKGKAREDDLFNEINDDENRITVNGVTVDVNPITKGKSGTIDEWIKRNEGFSKKTIPGERGGAVSGNPSSENLPLEGSEHLSHRPLTLPKDAAKLQKNSEITINSAKKIINSGELKGKTDTAAQAVSTLGHGLHLDKSGSSQSYYQDYYEGDFVVDGKVARVRISTHPATGKRIGNAPVDDKISIVIYKDGEHKDRGAHNGYVEYIYHPENISPKDASMAIVKSIEGLIRNGEYVDETGLAQKQEYPYVDDNGNMRFSFSERDKEYADAVAAGDKEKVDAMLREEAERKGYSEDSSYQGSIAFNGAAPSRNGYFETRQERKEAWDNEEYDGTFSLGDYKEAGIDTNDLEWQLTSPVARSRATEYQQESIDNLNKGLKSKSGKIKMYRAVDADIKENSFRNGDWITPSREYAQKHIGLQDWKKGRVIEQEVSIDDVWWDGNDINEWGYDDGKGYVYKNTENNRKLLEATYDDKGNLIPLSKRFDEKKSDVKFSIPPKKNADGDTEFSYEGDPKFSIRVFHGSGADFEKFDHSHMGEGEGNQSFGWGTYVTEVEGVGRQYAESVGNGVTYKGKKMYADPYSDIPADRALFYIEQEGGTDKAIKFLKELIREEDDADTKREYQECIDVLRDKKSWGKSERHIYEVEIPDDNGRNYIDWKAPLTEENKEDIRAGLLKDKFFRGQEQMTYDDLKSRGLDVPGFEEWLGLRADVLTTSYNGEDFYKGLSQALGGDQIASEFLRDCGFTGIKYPVNAMSGGNKEGTNNYVIFDENDAQIVNNTKFSFPKKKEDKTLMGVHNISEDKLKKALKLGGLANPSLAVIDTEKQSHTGFGDISLIPKSSLIDAKTGRNAGTYLGDAWTPTYPNVTKSVSKQGEAHIKAIAQEAAGGDETLANRFERAIHDYVNGNSGNLAFLFLKQKGLNPEVKYPRISHSHEEYEQIEKIFGKGTALMPSRPTDEQNKALFDMMVAQRKAELEKRAEKISDEAKRKTAVDALLDDYKKDIADENGKVYLARGDSFVNSIFRDEQRRNRGEIDWYGTDLDANNRVAKEGLSEEYNKWKENLLGDEDINEELFAGWTKDGYRRYVPNTVENASRLMNKETQTNSNNEGGIGATKSALLKKVSTLAAIRKNKGKLQDAETVSAKMQEASDELLDMIHYLADRQKVDDNRFINLDIAEHRLQEALAERNPVKYLNKEYRYNIDENGEYAQQIKDFIKMVGELPAKYFETKFRRPVGLNEFAVAVVPEGTSEEVIKGLKDAGLDVRTYDGTEENRKAVTMNAVNGREDIKFSIAIERSDPFYSNAAKATEDIRQEKATGDQWIAMIKKNGGLKAEEDKWMGLSDWLRGKKSVTKAELQKFIADNAVEIEDVEYAAVQDIADNPKFRQYNEEYQEIIDNADRYYDKADAEYAKFMNKMKNKYGERWIYDMDEREQKLENRLLEQRSRFMDYDSNSIREIAYEVMCERHGDDFRDAFDLDYDGLAPSTDWNGNLTGQAKYFLEFKKEPINSTRLDYTTEGLENKREIALTVPTIEPYNEHDEIHFGDAGGGRAVAWIRFGDAEIHDPEIKKSLDSASEELYDYLDRMSEKYETNPDHPEQIEDKLTAEEKAEHQRIMANIRKYDEANDANTKKVLVIDEIQSKRHQDGREKGYKKEIPSDAPELIAFENAEKETEQYLSMLREKYGRNDVSYGLTEGERQKLDELHDKRFKAKIDYSKFLQENKLGAFSESNVPNAPFQKTWHELAMKRMLRYAAENGYDKIAWTTGEQQAERYNLREKVDEIKVANAYDTDAHEPVFTVIGRKDGGILVQEDVVGEKGMTELLGKELARKAYSNLKEGKDDYLNEDGAVVFSGDNLAIGGEGMKGFYDRMLPQFMDKYGKKWGVKTGEVELDLPNEADRVMHSVDVTPEMKESVMKGQPKFSISIPKNEEEYDKKETAWHTVIRETVVTRHAEAPDRSVDAKPLTAAKLQKIEKTTKSFDEIIAAINKKSLSRDELLNRISGSLGFRNGERQSSKYGSPFTLGNGDEIYFRISNHAGNMFNFELFRQNDLDSYGVIVNAKPEELRGARRPRFIPNKNVDHLELQYYTQRFDDVTESQKQKLEIGIVEGLKHLVNTGGLDRMPLPDVVNPSGVYKRIFEQVKNRIEEEENIKFSIRVPEGKTKAQMQAETDRDIAQRRNVVREGDTYEDVLRKAKAVRDADELVKIEQTISDNQIKPGDSFEEVLRKAEALKTAAADQQKFAFSREERARQAYERDRKRQQKEINDAQKALRKKIVDEINYLMNDQHLTVFNKSTLSRLLKDVQNADADNIGQTVTSIRTEIDRLTDKSQQRQLEDLMKLKTRDQNGKGMAIAKNVSDSVRRILGMIQGRIVDLKSTGYEEDMTQLRRQNWFLPGENMRLRRTIERLQKEEPTAERTQDMIDAEIAEAEAKIKENEAQIEANKAELADLKVRKQEAESAKALASDADVAEEIAKLMEKMDEHVAGKSAWTPSDSEKLTALQILQLKQQADGKRREIEDMKRKLAELEDSLSRYQAEARRPQRYIPRQRMEQLEQQIQGMKQAINQATDELIGQNGNLIDIVKDLVEEGKSSLVNKIQAENNRKYDILHGVITDIMGDKQIPTDQQTKKEQLQEGKWKKFFSAQLHSFEYLAKRINENSLGEDGWFYNYFVKGKNGVMQAETNHQLGLRDAVETLDAKAQEIYGCSYTEASKRNAEVDNHSGVFIYRDANGMEIEEEQPLSKGQAMYIYMVWKMPDGKMKLQNQGFTDESIAQIREFLSPEDMQFADWIQDEFLKDRRAKYNDLYVELYNTSMANIENYVPLKILETEVKRDSNLSDDSGRKQTLEEKAGALIERKFNLSQVDITKNAFDVIAEHINNMEEWHAYARVRKDLDYVLSNTFVRNQLNANSAGRYNQLYDAAAIAAHAYKPNKAEHMDEVVGWLTKGLVGGNIAFRNSTALKQILSVPAFYGYCEDPKFWAALTANIGMQYVRNAPAVLANMATYGISGKAGFKLADKGKMKSLMSENIVWCMKNVPSFRNRVLKGTVGLEYMDQKLKGKVGELVDKYLDYGMATNQMIDAITCSVGIKSIFDYRYAKLSEGIEKDTSLTVEQKAEALEEAKRQAIMDADIYYNATQQSNHSAFMSPMQLSRSMINRAFSVYQNASIGYARKAVSAGQNVYKIARNFSKLQNEYARRYMAEDANMDRDEAMDKAHEYLTDKLTHNILNAFHYGYTMNWLWDLGSKGLLGLWWWSSQRDEDKEKELRKEAGLEDNIGLRAYDIAAKAGELTTYPGRGLTGMNMASSLINGSLNNPLLLIDELDEMQQDVKKYLEDGNYAAIASQALFHGLKTSGFDARVHYNTVAGVYGMSKAALTGNQDSDFMINLMLALNTPNTNRRAVAEELYKDYPLDTYVSNIMEASKYTDNEYLALFPGMKLLTAKNQMQIYKEFAFNNLTDEERSMLKGVTKMKLDQLRTTAELTDAYNKETDVKIKEAIGRMIIKNMKDELSKNNTPEDLLKKAKESLLGKESAAKNVIYTALCTSNDLIDDEMLKEAIADLKPVMDQLKEIEDEGTIDQEKEYTSLHKAEIDEYERLKDLQKLISEDKRDLKDATPEERIDLMNDIRQLRNEALKRGNAKDGKNKE